MALLFKVHYSTQLGFRYLIQLFDFDFNLFFSMNVLGSGEDLGV